MSDLALNLDGLGYDVALVRNKNGKRDFVIVRKGKALAQRAQMFMRTFLEECRYDRSAGVPYQQVLFTHGMTANSFRAIIEQQLQRVPGVLYVISVDLELNRETRVMSGTCEVFGDDGEAHAFPLTVRFP